MTGLVGRLRDGVRRKRRWQRHAQRWRELVAAHPLRYLFLEVTRRCNLSCLYCGSSCSPKSKFAELATEEWISIAHQLAGDFDPSQVMVAVTGGEPFLKEGILDLFCALRESGFPFGVVTNGYFMDVETAKNVVDAGIGSVSLSMDAPPSVNDRLRAPDASEKVVWAISNLKKAGFKGKLEIISTITKPAVPLLQSMRRYVSKLKVPLWRLSPVMPIGRAARRKDLLPEPADVFKMLDFIRNAREDDLLPAPEFSEEGYLGDGFEGLVRPYLCQCRAGVTTGGILCDGRIGACPELGDAYVQGDIRVERFKEVWETRYRIMRDRSWTRKGICADCDFYARCLGGSLHLYETPESPLLRCLYHMTLEGQTQVPEAMRG